MPTTLFRAAGALLIATALISAASPVFAKTVAERTADYQRCLANGGDGDGDAVDTVCCIAVGGTPGTASDTTTANGTHIHVNPGCLIMADLSPTGPTSTKHPLPSKVNVTDVASK